MEVRGFAFREPNAPLEPLARDEQIGASGDVLVRVAGCGLCHTDLTFYTGEVAPRHELPLILGHEISGVVEAAGDAHSELVGRPVLVPAVMPCGECDRCRAGRPNICVSQVMPGNDVHGGFATHVRVPGRTLVPLPEDLGSLELADLSVIADAVTTPYQAVERAEVGEADVVVVIGVGGIGTYGVQIAAARGGRVIAVDIDESKLARVADLGALRTVCIRGLEPYPAKKAITAAIREEGLPGFGWKILEMSGTSAGQQLAFQTLPPGGTLGVIGFTAEKVNVRLSNLMAFDARAFGNWGCDPALYPEALQLVLDGSVRIDPFIEKHDLSQIGEVFQLALGHELDRRAILVPEGS